MYSAYKIDDGLFNGFSFISLMPSGIVEWDLIYNIPYMIVELSVISVFVVGMRFLDLRTIG
jgi:hypothetical protein